MRGLYLADFSGMTVQSLSLLRKRCREQGVQFRVIKNTLLKRAFNERGIKELDDHLVGPTGLVFSPVNEMAPAKILSDFAKECEKPGVKAAVVDGRLYDTKAITQLAKLTSREVLLSQLIDHVSPAISGITSRGQSPDDAFEETITRLLTRLRHLKAHPGGSTISNFDHYIKVVAKHMVAEQLRDAMTAHLQLLSSSSTTRKDDERLHTLRATNQTEQAVLCTIEIVL